MKTIIHLLYLLLEIASVFLMIESAVWVNAAESQTWGMVIPAIIFVGGLCLVLLIPLAWIHWAEAEERKSRVN